MAELVFPNAFFYVVFYVTMYLCGKEENSHSSIEEEELAYTSIKLMIALISVSISSFAYPPGIAP